MPITPEEISGKEFLDLGGGYDRGEVRAYLETLAEEHRALLARIEEHDSTETGTPGPEVTRILASATNAAEELLAKAERRASDRLEAAEKEAVLLRDAVAASIDEARREADEYAERTRAEADADARARLAETTRRVERLLSGEARVRDLVYSLEVLLPEIREDLLTAERDLVEGIDRTIVLDEAASAEPSSLEERAPTPA